jgi:metallophosphoesterase (TIGR03768 family)
MNLRYFAGACCALLLTLAIGMPNAPAQSPGKAAHKIQRPLPDYPIAPEVYTTRQRIVVPDPPTPFETVYPYQINKYDANGYGHWHYEQGVDCGKLFNLMPVGYNAVGVSPKARLLNFFTITDIHLADEESPVQGIYSGYLGGNSSAYSAVMMLTTQVLDAAIQTVNALHQQKPFDFGLSIGDAANGSQYNELRWYIDILDGKLITPDSGVKDDPIPGPLNDYQDTYQAAGLDPSIPWYQTLGNHDHAWLGSYPVTDYLRRFYTGTEILLMGDLFTDGPDSRVAYLGALDGTTSCGTIIGVGPVANFTVNDVLTTPTVRAADANRRPLSRSEWMNEFATNTSNPPGHGFTQANVTSDSANYSFEPKADLPIKVIVLDDTQYFDVDNMDTEFEMHGQGYLNQERFDWLVSELDKGQAEGKLMIISAHVPLQIISIAPLAPSAITSTTLLTKLSSYSNLILWVTGHRHRNVVTPRPSIDPNYASPEYGFWEVETASLRDFPQQFRTFEIVRNSDNTLSIITTDVDPAVRPGSPADLSRTYAVASAYLFNEVINYPPADVYNVELLKQLNPAMQSKIQLYGTPIQSACQTNFNLYK